MLYGQVVAYRASRLPVVRIRHCQPERQVELYIRRRQHRSKFCRERISNPLVGIHERNAVSEDLRAEGRTVDHVVIRLHKRRLVEHAEAAADYSRVFRVKGIGEPDTWREVPPCRLAAAVRAVRISGEQISGRSVGKASRLFAGGEALGTAKLIGVRQEWIPAQTEVYCQVSRHANVVLDEQAAEIASARCVFTSALLEPIEHTDEEVGARIAAEPRSTEAEPAALPERVNQVDVHAQEIAAERYLML